MAPEKDKLKDHSFDGIREYDNPIPLWLNIILWGSIIFAIGYFPYYHMFGGKLPREQYAEEVAAYEAKRAELEAAKPQLDVAALANDEQAIAAGKDVYMANCASCHGQQAEGLVGPGFNDTAWRNGDGSLKSIINIVENGILDKGMPAWAMLGDQAVANVSAYIYNLSTPNGEGGPSPDFMREGGAAMVTEQVVDKVEDAVAADAAAADGAPDLEAGKQAFQATCVACHGPDGKGGENLLGPDLTDSEWINGDGSLASIEATIRNGVPAKGMPPWSSLGDATIRNLSAYVQQLSDGG